MDVAGSKRRSPWFEIWFHPRRATRRALRDCPAHWPFAVVAATYFTSGLVQSLEDAVDLGATYVNALALLLIAAVLTSVLYLILNGWLLAWTGGWLGGSASSAELRTTLAVPHLILLWYVPVSLGVALATLLGGLPAEVPTLHEQPIPALVFLAHDVVQIALLGWFIVAHTACLSEAQGFSVSKAILNGLIAVVVLVALAFLFLRMLG